MSILLPLLLVLILVAVVASLHGEGMWSNAIALINVATAGLLATSYWEPVADSLEEWNDFLSTYTYMMDFLVIWLLFVLFLIALRLLTDSICRVKVRFLKLADRIGGLVFASLLGMTMVCFTTFTLHTAPLAKNFMDGAFQSETGVVWGWAPDRWWLAFSRYTSNGCYCWPTVNRFDAGTFVKNYEARRAEIEQHVNSTDSLRK